MSEPSRGASIQPKKRGRPKGSLNGFADRTKKWQPKKWKPLYEAIVSMHVQGYMNKFIAQKLDITEQTVSNVIGCDMARGVISAMQKTIRDRSAETAIGKIQASQDLIAKRIHQVLADDELAEKAPLAIGAFAIKAGQAIGALRDNRGDGSIINSGNNSGNVSVTQNNFFADRDGLKTLADGFIKAQRARELHSGITGESIGVIKNEFERIPVSESEG